MIAHFANNKLGNLKFNYKFLLDEVELSKVYKLVSVDCGANYIDRTFRSIKTTKKEHFDEVKKSDLKSSFAKHLKIKNHSFCKNMINLHSGTNNTSVINNLETLEIKKNRA